MKQKTLLASAITAALLLSSWSVAAQDSTSGTSSTDSTDAAPAKAKKLDTITVTGSRIRSADVATAQPVFTMTKADIKVTGLTNVNDILQRMPGVGSPDISPQDSLSSGTSVGGRYTDLRNLGSSRVLVLVNGRRWSTNLDGLTDLSTIPVSIIDHIDVLKDGASSVYGADAIAGVVNIITVDHFDGAQANVTYGRNQAGDGTSREYDFTWGHTTAKSNFVFNVNKDDSDPVMDNTRALTRYADGPRHTTDGLGLGAYGRVVDPTTGDSYVVNHGAGGVGNTADIGNYHLADGDPADAYNTNKDTTFRSGSNLKNLFAQERYALTDNINIHGLYNYSERDTTGQLAGYPLSSAGTGVTIDPDNAYNPYPDNATEFYRRTVELPRKTETKVNMIHYELGLDGYFSFLDHDWSWDVNYDYSHTREKQLTSGNLYLPNVAKALGATTTINGQVVCASAADRAAGCEPWNILAGPGGTSQSVLNYVNYNGESQARSTTNDWTANVSGGLFDYWAGTVSVAAGIEHRGEKGSYTPDPNDAAGLTTNLASAATSGAYNLNEAYVELNVPVLKDLPGAQELSFDVASRYSHYSNFGGTTNNKYSFAWKPIGDLLVRGTFSKGFRAPTINDLYSGSGQSFDTFLDPCDSVYGARASNSSVAAKCSAAGVPANYRQLDQNGAAITSKAGGQTPNAFISGSNANLQPETSTTRTLGLVYSPSYVSGLDVSLDWYKVNMKNTIGSIDAAGVLNNCYVEGISSFCNDFTRDSTGAISSLNEGEANLGSLTTAGYDLGIHYRLPATPWGNFAIRSDSTYLTKYNSITEAGAAEEYLAGYQNGEQSLFRIRSNFAVDWNYGPFSATWTMRYYSGLKDSCYTATVECNEPNYTNSWIGDVGISQKGGVTFNDLQIAYAAPWNGTFSVGANNIFRRQGPLYYSVAAQGNGAGVYSPIMDFDRYYFVQYTQKF